MIPIASPFASALVLVLHFAHTQTADASQVRSQASIESVLALVVQAECCHFHCLLRASLIHGPVATSLALEVGLQLPTTELSSILSQYR